MIKNIFSHGGGTQSAAITALIVQGRLPKPDYVCIVDTEYEKSTTWQYMDSVIRPALKSIGLDVHRIRNSEYGSNPPHGKSWLSHNGNTILLPAFTDESGAVGKVNGFCSKTWKVQTQDRYIRRVLGVETKWQRKWIGFSTNESRRASRMMASPEYEAGLIWFPLIQGVPMNRQEAIREVEKMGWPTPPRSACWMCPNQKDDEWRDLIDNSPDDFSKAIEMERLVQQDDPHLWLHKSCKPLSQVDFSEPDDLSNRQCDSGGCFT